MPYHQSLVQSAQKFKEIDLKKFLVIQIHRKERTNNKSNKQIKIKSMMNNQMNNQNTSSILNQAVLGAQEFLTSFAFKDQVLGDLTTAFGDNYNQQSALSLVNQWQTADFSSFPKIEILSSSTINNANGAYSVDTKKIYLAEELLNIGDVSTITSIILEEYGHFVDDQINSVDASGDEGAIFSGLVQGQSFTQGELQELQAENDQAVVTIDGEEIAIEQFHLIGDDGNNWLRAAWLGAFDDYITGRGGDDTIVGGNGHDRLYGDDGEDILNGDSGDDFLVGGNGNDKMYGGDNNDILYGENGNDSLYGENGNDRLMGQGGNDILTGGLGSDTFRLDSRYHGIDTITDFKWREGDKVQINKSTFGVSDLSGFTVQHNNFTSSSTLSFHGQQIATLQNITNSYDFSIQYGDVVLV